MFTDTILLGLGATRQQLLVTVEVGFILGKSHDTWCCIAIELFAENIALPNKEYIQDQITCSEVLY